MQRPTASLQSDFWIEKKTKDLHVALHGVRSWKAQQDNKSAAPQSSGRPSRPEPGGGALALDL